MLDECKPGLRPVEYNVIVAPTRVSDKAGSILKPDEYRETEEMAMQVGRIIAMSPLAFNYDQWLDNAHLAPKVGDIVWYARYAGALVEKAFDGQMYRMIKDKDIAAVIEQSAEEPELSPRVKTYVVAPGSAKIEVGDPVIRLDDGTVTSAALGPDGEMVRRVFED